MWGAMTYANDTEVLKRDGIEFVERSEERQLADARKTAVASAIAIAVVAIAYWLLIRSSDDYRTLQSLQFSGSSERLAELDLVVTVDAARNVLWRAVLFSVVWGVIGWVLFTRFWAGAWKAGPGTKMSGGLLGLAFGLGGAAFGLVEKLFTIVAIRASGTGIRYVNVWQDAVPKAIVTLAWVKWLLAGIMALLGFAMLVSSATAAIRRLLPATEQDVPDTTPGSECHDDPAGVGICCSGGGIRAAGFALGALSRLEKEPENASVDGKLGVLGRADYLSSVSGGGYAAAAWRIAAGPGPLPDHPVIGDPTDPKELERVREYPDPDEPAYSLLQHIRERRRYLANGPGGMLTSVLIVIRNMAFHFSLLILTVIALAWPLGRAIVSSAITGDGRSPTAMVDGLTTTIGIHQWFPPTAMAVAAIPFLLMRLVLDRKPLRKAVDLAIVALLGIAASLAILLVVLPLAVDAIISLLPEGGGLRLAVGGIYGVIVTALWQLTKTRLKASARYLGGLALFAGLIAFGLLVMAHAADTDQLFSSPWRWLAALAGMVIAFIFFNPDRWSLHGFYRQRLAGTFSTIRSGSEYLTHTDEPPIFAYAADNVEGPKPIICCAAAREDGHQTGVPVLSMTFEPSCITVYRWSDQTSSAQTAPARMSHAQFRRRLPKGSHGRHLNTLMGLAAVSGAAVAPSLGRLSLKGSDALLAAFNARLGVWVPNPSQQKWERSTTPRLVNMFKEISKTYDPVDPNVYATDGGHWENLGLVELVRRRCTSIIIIDTSGDLPGTYKTLKLAQQLAELECGAKVDLDEASWEHLAVVGPDDIVGRNYGVGTVEYDDGTTGRLLYLKAAVMQSSPLEIQRYAADDHRFPNYSTADQLLTANEFDHLLRLGYASMDEALDTHREFEESILGVAVETPAGASAE